MNRITCERCRYWDEEDVKVGTCRRLAPRLVDREGDRIFPFTYKADWCAEAQEKQA